jgi:cyclic dehypoxanthinyl futalosine synthase
MLAVSRLFLDNVQHIQASWLTQGLRLGQTSLRFGADDMGSIMIEENVVSAAGANTEANEKELRYQISEAGFVPQQRDILYEYINRVNVQILDEKNSLPLKQLSVAFAD